MVPGLSRHLRPRGQSYYPRPGYNGPLPGRREQSFNHFHANEARDRQGHVGVPVMDGAVNAAREMVAAVAASPRAWFAFASSLIFLKSHGVAED